MSSNPFEDPAPHILVDDFVQAKTEIKDGDEVVAKKGDVGKVVVKSLTQEHGWSLPTVLFERTGRAYDCTPEEIDVLCDGEFARTPETTPKKPRRHAVKRGVS